MSALMSPGMIASLAVLCGVAMPLRAVAAPTLTDVTTQSGLNFKHFNGMTGRLYYAETIGAGGALIDYDNDGDLDVFLVQGHLLGPDRKLEDALQPWPADQPLRDRLFRNDTNVDGEAGSLRFTDVTEQSLLRSTGYGIGATVGDIDNDGDDDLLVLNLGRNQLWLNNGDGTFTESAAAFGVDDPSFSVAASFTDHNRDQFLDLFVVNYVDFSFATHKQCLTDRGEQDYCGPKAFDPVADRLYINRSGTKFQPLDSGIVPAAGMGVVSADFDNNGSVDFYVANDLDPNQLWLSSVSDGVAVFKDEALLYGAARNKSGDAEASMGLAAVDFDGDGDLDLFATHFRRESNTLYIQDANGFFSDRTANLGLAQPSWSYTGFGTSFFDLEGDGDLDIVVANGAVTHRPGQDRSHTVFALDEPNQLYLNQDGQFVDVSDRFPALNGKQQGVSRSILIGDLDNDGDSDFIVTNNSGEAVVIRNDSWTQPASRPRWIGLDLRLSEDFGNRTALGASIEFEPSGVSAHQPRRVRVHNDGGYASAGDARVVRVVGMGQASQKALRFIVTWPDGSRERFQLPNHNESLDRYHRVLQGTGVNADATQPDTAKLVNHR